MAVEIDDLQLQVFEDDIVEVGANFGYEEQQSSALYKMHSNAIQSEDFSSHQKEGDSFSRIASMAPTVSFSSSREVDLLSHIERSVIGGSVPVQTPFGVRKLTYADYTASGRGLSFIEDAIRHEVLPHYANTHTTASHTGRQTSRYREEARKVVFESVNGLPGQDAVVFAGSGCTAAIYKMVQLLKQSKAWRESAASKQRPLVIVGPYEHHSNILPWRESDVDVVEVQLEGKGGIDLEDLRRILKQNTARRMKVGSFSAASNVTGILTDVEEIATILHEHGALAMFDYAAAGPYVDIDMNPYRPLAYKDAVFISPHKFVGGPSTPGVLVFKKAAVYEDGKGRGTPSTPAGGTVLFVSNLEHRYLDSVEEREEGGTPEIIGAVRCGLVFRLKMEVGAKTIEERERHWWEQAKSAWGGSRNLFLLGDTSLPRLSIVSFVVGHGKRLVHHGFIASLLNDLFGIQSRSGCSCAGPYGQRLFDICASAGQAVEAVALQGEEAVKPGFVRVNFNFFLAEETARFIIDAVLFVAEHGWKLLPLYHLNPRTGEWRCKGGKQGVEEERSLRSISFFPLEQETPRSDSEEPLSPADVELYFEQARQLVAETVNQARSGRLRGSSLGFASPEIREEKWFLSSEEAVRDMVRGEVPEPMAALRVYSEEMEEAVEGCYLSHGLCLYEVWVAVTRRRMEQGSWSGGTKLSIEGVKQEAAHMWQAMEEGRRREVKRWIGACVLAAMKHMHPLGSGERGEPVAWKKRREQKEEILSRAVERFVEQEEKQDVLSRKKSSHSKIGCFSGLLMKR